MKDKFSPRQVDEDAVDEDAVVTATLTLHADSTLHRIQQHDMIIVYYFCV